MFVALLILLAKGVIKTKEGGNYTCFFRKTEIKKVIKYCLPKHLPARLRYRCSNEKIRHTGFRPGFKVHRNAPSPIA
jgi:hypothetical protein